MEIVSALTSLKLAFDMTKAMKDIRDATVFQGKVFELQRVILEAQEQAIEAREAQTAQVERIRNLEAEVASLKAWGHERENYQLKQVDVGALVYMLKPEHRGTQPAHWLCANCYESGKKSLLQNQGRTKDGAYALFKCPTCQSALTTHWNKKVSWPD